MATSPAPQHNRNRPTASDDGANPSPPRLGPLLRIEPKTHETQFWQSVVHRRAASTSDTWCFILRMFNSMLLLQACSRLPAEARSAHFRNSINSMLLGLVHIAFKLIAPEEYFSLRWLLSLHYRFYIFLLTVVASTHSRRILMSGGYYTTLIAPAVIYHAKGSPLLATARALVLGNGALATFAHAFNPTLPFPLQAFIQTLYCILLITRGSIPTTHILSDPKFSSGTQQLCTAIATAPRTLLLSPIQALLSLAAPSLAPPALPAPHLCTTQSTWLLVLYAYAILTFVAPLYCSYVHERRLKLTYLRDCTPLHEAPTPHPSLNPSTPGLSRPLHPTAAPAPTPRLLSLSAPPPDCSTTPPGGPQPPQPRTPTKVAAGYITIFSSRAWGCELAGTRPLPLLFSCCYHAGLLLLLSQLTWQLVVALHAPLARWLEPLPFPGAHDAWYWELLCGTDAPCCPA